ncbi:MAG: hypothetical protein MZU79_05315 [Anaerotruncus sp.]|nr:hypothetical protein [Anaerotruncus sp.]
MARNNLGRFRRDPQEHADDDRLQRRERLLEPGLQHREPRRSGASPSSWPRTCSRRTSAPSRSAPWPRWRS